MNAEVVISKRLVLINALSSVLARLLSLSVLLWVNQYLLRRLSAEEYASYPVVVAVVLFAESLTAVFTGGIARYVTEAYAKGDQRRVTEIVSSMMPLIVASTVIFVVVGGLASWHVDFLLSIHPDQLSEAQCMMGLLVLGQGIALLVMPYSVGFYVRQKFIWLSLIRLGQELLRSSLLFVLLFGVSTRVLWVVVAAVTATLSGTLMTAMISRRLVPSLRFERGAFRKATARELTSFGAWTMLGNMVWRIRTSSDVIILNNLGTAVDVVAFQVGSMPDRQMEGFMAMASNTLQPALTAMHATNKRDSLRRAYLRGNRYHLWIALAVAVPVIVFAQELVTLYVGEKYLLAAAVAVLICGAYPLVHASEMLYRVAIATARVRGFFLVIIVAGLLKVGITIFLVGPLEMGAVGAAWSNFGVGIVTQLGFLWPMGLRMLDIPFRAYLRQTLIPGCVPAAVAAVVCCVIKKALPASSWPVLGVNVGLGLVIYGVVMRACFRPEDRSDLGRVLERITQSLRPNSPR